MENIHDKCEIIHKLIQTTRLHRNVIERFAASINLHSSGHRMLMYLSLFDKIPSQKELAQHFDISSAAVATTLKKLEADGYIERNKNQDIRYNEISITKLGKSTAAETEKYFRYVDTAALKGVSDEELDLFVKLLDKMQENLRNSEICPDNKDIMSISHSGKEI